MAVIQIVDPIPRIEGHMGVTLTISSASAGIVTDAQTAGNMYRGFENFLVGQEPLDAPLITQRVCGVCPTNHAIAAAEAMDDAAKVQPTPNGRLLRNLINGAEYLHSHVLHFYILALQDYIDMSSLGAPWAPLYGADRRVAGPDLTNFINHYLDAIVIRRKAHTICATLSGKQPHGATIIGGGCSATPSAADITTMSSLLTDIQNFVDNKYIPDANLLFNTYYADYKTHGVGPGKLLSYGVFPQGTDSVNSFLLKRGIYNGTSVIPVMDQNKIVEDVAHSWYTNADNLQPLNGVTTPVITPHNSNAVPTVPGIFPGKAGAYSWLKSPRYKTDGVNKDVYEVGPLARMVVTGDYTAGISVADREIARSLETKKVADAMVGWLTALGSNLSAPSFIQCEIPANGSGIGLTEAERGALGHWVTYDSNKKIAHYQIITPTCWNASPMDANGAKGAIEQALIGTPIANASQPVEALRVIHSFDPCLACAVHVITDDGKTINKFIVP